MNIKKKYKHEAASFLISLIPDIKMKNENDPCKCEFDRFNIIVDGFNIKFPFSSLNILTLLRM